MRKCDRCGRGIGKRPWAVRVFSAWGIQTAYKHEFEICEECAADLRKFMRIDERKCVR